MIEQKTNFKVETKSSTKERRYDYTEEMALLKKSYLTLLIIIICLVNFTIAAVKDKAIFQFTTETLLATGATLNTYFYENRYWTLLTDVFCHNGIGHIVYNLTFFILVAPYVEIQMGRLFFAVLFITSAITSGIINFIVISDQYMISYGLSGVVFAAMGSYFFVKTNMESNKFIETISVLFFMALFFFLIDILSLGLSSAIAHFTGFLTGIILTAFFIHINKQEIMKT